MKALPWIALGLGVVGVSLAIYYGEKNSTSSGSGGSGGASGGGTAPLTASSLVTDPATVEFAQLAMVELAGSPAGKANGIVYSGPVNGDPNDPAFLAALKQLHNVSGLVNDKLDFVTLAALTAVYAQLFNGNPAVMSQIPVVTDPTMIQFGQDTLTALANAGWVPNASLNDLTANLRSFQQNIATRFHFPIRRDGVLDVGTLAAEVLAMSGNLH